MFTTTATEVIRYFLTPWMWIVKPRTLEHECFTAMAGVAAGAAGGWRLPKSRPVSVPPSANFVAG